MNADSASRLTSEWKVQGLYVRRTAEAKRFSEFEKVQLAGDARRFVDDSESGHRSEFVCSIPMNWVPERDIFDPEAKKLLARGWRSIVLQLVNRRLTTIDKARAAFGSSLGEQSYDRMSFDQRLAEATPKAGKIPAWMKDPRILGLGNY